MKVLILAAGYATRLYPLTLERPKPLLEISGRSILDRIIDKVSAADSKAPVYIVTNNKFFGNFEAWRQRSFHKDRITVINDRTESNETRLGAIKDMELVLKERLIDDDVLVVAGDNLFDCDMRSFLDFARRHNDGVCVALHDIGSLERAKKFGIVKLDAQYKVIDFAEKPQNPQSTLTSTGIYYFPKEKLALISAYNKSEGQSLDAPGYCIRWLSKVDKVYGYVFSEDWDDIGDIETYNIVDKKYKEKEK